MGLCVNGRVVYEIHINGIYRARFFTEWKRRVRPSPLNSGEMKRILVVDDDPSSIELLIRFLKPWKCEVEVAFSGGEAVEKLQGGNFPYHLVISDIRMPHGTGIDLLREIQILRKRPGEKAMPVILMSALGKVAQEQAKALGAEFLEKPITRESLSTVLARVGEPLGTALRDA